jgi:cell wall-active antibiotic response 4TMS protein YvqF
MEPVLFCPQCGARTEGGKFCRSCGTNLVVISEAISQPAFNQGLDAIGSSGTTVRIFGGGAVSNQGKELNNHTTLAVFGGIEIDLTAAPLPVGELKINVISIFGGTEIIVPDDVGVRISGITLFGGYEVLKKDSSGGLFHINDYYTPGYEHTARRVHINATTLFGGFDIRKPKRRRKHARVKETGEI